MRIVISGYYGYGNAGDEWVLAGMLRLFRAQQPDLVATVISGDPAETERTHRVAAVPRMSLGQIRRALREADGLISGGGGLLQDRTSARPVAYYGGIAEIAHGLNRPYVVFAQSLGPIRRRLNRLLARRMLERAAHVSLRDPQSIDLARRLGVRRPIDLVPDPALALDPPPTAPPGRLVVAVRDWPSRPPHLPALRAALGELGSEFPIVAVPMQESVDRRPSLEVIEGISGATALPVAASLDERLAVIGSGALVLGMRLHALVAAAAAGVPAVAISYDPKVEAFAGQAGQRLAGRLEDGIDPAAVADAVRQTRDADPSPYLQRIATLRGNLPAAATAALDALAGGSAPGS